MLNVGNLFDKKYINLLLDYPWGAPSSVYPNVTY